MHDPECKLDHSQQILLFTRLLYVQKTNVNVCYTCVGIPVVLADVQKTTVCVCYTCAGIPVVPANIQ